MSSLEEKGWIHDVGSRTITSPRRNVDGSRITESREYFRRLRRRVLIGLSFGFLVPLGILALYFHFQLNLTLKESGKLHLTTIAVSQSNTIDLFLQERVVNIFNLFHRDDFTVLPGSDDMRRYLQSLHEASDAFVDVGFLDASGRQVGYAGPYPYLHGEDYGEEDWFQTLIGKEQTYHITNIYLGLRKKPHFTIAVRQLFGGKACVMRATLDPDKFYMFLRGISRDKRVNASLVSWEGTCQVVDPDRCALLGRAGYVPPEGEKSGAHELANDGDTELVAHAWLKEVPWALIVRQPLGIAYASMYKARRIMIGSILLLVLILLTVIWLTTDRLLRRAQLSEESRMSLKSQLFHAAKLASVGELAAGVAHEINNPLAIVVSESGWIQDILNPEFGMEFSRDKMQQSLKQIDQAVFRAKNITHKLLNFARKNEPRLSPCNVNQMLEDVVSGLKEQEFCVSNIELARDYAVDIPDIHVDPDQIRQVFLNLINNAQDAIEGSGTITLKTERMNGSIRVTVSDTGKGMSTEETERIFFPFYTTKEVGKGTGLGLSVSLSIVEAMGGRIEVQSLPGAGSSFIVVLPIERSEEHADAAQQVGEP
jgi:two-component system NtrC family sensor kinase